jgi:hypothetical protein
MNPGTFQGPGTGVVAGTISRYIQTPVLFTSQTIAVPPGTQRIEALLVGGGGAGTSEGAGGGFGGSAIIEIPVTGSPLQVVIGAGGTGTNSASTNTAGSPTYVISAGTRYAEVGGGGCGVSGNNTIGLAGSRFNGRSGGGGGGGRYTESTSLDVTSYAGSGGGPPIGNLLWSIYPAGSSQYITPSSSNFSNVYIPVYAPGIGGFTTDPSGSSRGYGMGANGILGGGGGGGNGTSGFTGVSPGYGGGGGGNTGSIYAGQNGNFGGGGGGSNFSGANGGSLTSVSIWGFTGGAGGTGNVSGGGGGGGGLFGDGTSANSALGRNGGLGGGGGGGGNNNTSGSGGTGAAVIRFYL